MATVQKEGFNITGIYIRTTNAENQAMKDIGALWDRFLSENWMARISGRLDNSIYSVYTDYEGDFTKPYGVILGCRTSDGAAVPEGMITRRISAGTYEHRIIKGNIMEGVVGKAWSEIWNSDLQRTYTADFEVYGEKASDPTNAVIDLFISLQS